MAILQQGGIPTNDQLSKGDYYNDLAKKRREEEQELYKIINENREPIVAPTNDRSNELPHYNLKLADTTDP